MKGTVRLRQGTGAFLALGLIVAATAGSAPSATSSDTAWTLAGTGAQADSGDGGQAREAAINRPRSVFPTADGGYIWAEPWSNRVRKVSADGTISTVAGTGGEGYSGDGGPATAAMLDFVHSASPTPDNGFLVADELNNRIRKVSPAGIITTVAGDGVADYGGDGGPATAASINNPRGVVSLADGSFLIPDSNNHRVRKVSASGVITTVAGTGVQGFSGDGGLATSAQLSIPFGVAPTPDGGFLIVDVGNQRIRKVSSTGIITTVAGNGVLGYSGDGGRATAASLAYPHNVVADPSGGFFIADASNQRVRYVSPSGTISTIIGDGTMAYSGDGGPSSSAQVSVPKAVALTPSGNLLIADEQNSRIRFVGTVQSPSNTTLPTLAGTPSQGQTLSGTAGGWSGTGPTFTYQWRRCETSGAGCVDIGGATAKTYTLAAGDVGSTIRLAVTASNSSGSSQASSSASSVVGAPLVPPSNTSPPTVSGTASEGQTLTANDGTWSGSTPMTFSYRWQRCSAQGGSCTSIAGATAKTYVVLGADVGATIRVGVTAANGAGTSTYSSAVTADAPSSYWRLADTGTTATDSRGAAAGTYVGSPQQGVTGLPAGDSDKAVTLDGGSQYVEVPGASAWTPGAFSIELLVRASAVPDNRTIAAAQGSVNGWWLNTDSTGRVRFFIGDGASWQFASPTAALPVGATKHIVATYSAGVSKLYVDGALVSTGPLAVMSPNLGANPLRIGSASSFVGQYWPGTVDDVSFYPVALSASQVSAHASAALNTTSNETFSAATSPVTGVAPSNTALPVLSGTAQVGQTLTVSNGTWSGSTPMSFTYQWRRCDASGGACVDVAGATASTYMVVSGDLGSTLRAVVTASNGGGSAAATSPQTAAVTASAAPPSSATPPSVTGTLAQGGVLTADEGTWSGATPITFAYQWSRCNASGSSCSDIAGATAKTYTVGVADVGATLRVRVNASNSAGSSDYAARVDAASPVSYWRLSETSGPAVDVRGFANGSYVGSPSRGVPGLLAQDGNQAVSLDGSSQYVDVPANAAWTGTPFSLELLVKPSAVPANRTIWSTMGPGFTGWWLNTGPTGVIRMFIGDGSAWRYDSSAPALAAGTTYHVLATYDGSTARLYLNGVLVSTGPAVTMASNVAGSVMRFGAFSTGPGQYWPGVIDDAGFYPSVLSPSAITAHYDASAYGSSALSAATAVVAGTAPANTAPPTISGTVQQGQTLTSTTGTWTGTAPISYTRQWRRCDTGGAGCVDIAGATGTTYTLVAGDVGSTIRVRVTATNSTSSTSADSAATAVVVAAPAAPVSTSPPVVSGSAVSGQTLTTTDGTWTGTAPITYTRQWRRCDAAGSACVDIAGATGSSYALVSGDVGSTIRARVTATNASGSATADSAATAVVTSAPTPPSNSVLPVVSGSAQSGQSVSVSNGSWSGSTPMSFGYQWRRCDASGAGCVDIAGASSSSYAVVSGDVGSTLRAVVTASNGAGSSSATSAQTTVVTVGSSSGTMTFSVAAGGDDGDLQVRSAASQGYPPSGGAAANSTGNAVTAGRRLAFGNYSVLVPLLRFDTSGLPDGATITSATLKLFVVGKADADNRSLMAEWYPASNWPIDAADYSLDSTGSALAGADITPITVGAVNSFDLTGVSAVSTIGATVLRLHVSGGIPAGDNYVQMAAFENSNPEAQLVVTWTTP